MVTVGGTRFAGQMIVETGSWLAKRSENTSVESTLRGRLPCGEAILLCAIHAIKEVLDVLIAQCLTSAHVSGNLFWRRFPRISCPKHLVAQIGAYLLEFIEFTSIQLIGFNQSSAHQTL